MTKVEVLNSAYLDLKEAYQFYESQEIGLGEYFRSQIQSDIDGLRITAGIHPKGHRDLYRLGSRKFPFSIYYTFSEEESAVVVAVVDCRRNPDWIRSHLDKSVD